MPKRTWSNWLKALLRCVKPGGCLIFTAHGLVSMNKSFAYEHLDDDGFWFLPESEQKDINTVDYGSTVTSPVFVFNQLKNAGQTRFVQFKEAFWWGHQDLYIVKVDSNLIALKKNKRGSINKTELAKTKQEDLLWIDTINKKTIWNIDNDHARKLMPINGKILTISGWGIDKDRQEPAYDLELLIDDNKYIPLYGYERKDIGKWLGSKFDNTGFIIKLPLTAFKNGINTIMLKIPGNENSLSKKTVKILKLNLLFLNLVFILKD
jgi:hypothetical protein